MSNHDENKSDPESAAVNQFLHGFNKALICGAS